MKSTEDKEILKTGGRKLETGEQKGKSVQRLAYGVR